MNNAAYWEPVEEHLAAHRELRAPMRAVVEHVVQVDPGAEVVRTTANRRSDDLEMQLVSDDTMHASYWCGRRNV